MRRKRGRIWLNKISSFVMSEKRVEEQVCLLHSQGQWKEIINLGTNEEDYEGRRLLWVWPSLHDLDWIKNVIEDYRLAGIASIGCGSGLLEWIIQQHSSCRIVGLEADKSWWSSGYSPPQFLKKTIFIDDEDADLRIPETYALLFCYFNNGKAFRDYMRNYMGNIVIVIGPDMGQNRSTDPLPFDKKFQELGWKLRVARKFDNHKDFGTVYTRGNLLDTNNFTTDYEDLI